MVSTDTPAENAFLIVERFRLEILILSDDLNAINLIKLKNNKKEKYETMVG